MKVATEHLKELFCIAMHTCDKKLNIIVSKYIYFLPLFVIKEKTKQGSRCRRMIKVSFKVMALFLYNVDNMDVNAVLTIVLTTTS